MHPSGVLVTDWDKRGTEHPGRLAMTDIHKSVLWGVGAMIADISRTRSVRTRRVFL